MCFSFCVWLVRKDIVVHHLGYAVYALVSVVFDIMINLKKWHTFIAGEAISEAFQVSIALEEQITELVNRYERRLSDISESVKDLESKVSTHLAKMGFEL